jgi:hypothetical protein
MKSLFLFSIIFISTTSFASLRECRSIDKVKYNPQRISCFTAFTDPGSQCSAIDINSYQDEFEACSLAEFYAAHSRIGEDSECELIDKENYQAEYLACLSLDLNADSDCRSIDKNQYPEEFVACAQVQRSDKASVNSSSNFKSDLLIKDSSQTSASSTSK